MSKEPSKLETLTETVRDAMMRAAVIADRGRGTGTPTMLPVAASGPVATLDADD